MSHLAIVPNIPLSILMPDADHLREIDHCRLVVFFRDHDVEFVEIPVDQTNVCHTDDKVHELGVEDRWVV